MEVRNTMMEQEVKKSEMVEIIMETEAEAGVSGICVAGGGKSGIFIKDILKDSPAAKSLSLQEGDQLLSAKVYFDNVKYEDALQILQCAEPYKISFCLKRNVQSADVSMSPGSGTFEVKGPKAKMPKMTVKSLTPVKKKVKSPVRISGEGSVEEGEDEDGELSAGKIDIAPVDVEFSLPRFGRFKKAKGSAAAEAADGSLDLKVKRSASDGKAMKLKLPRMRVKDAAAMESLALETHGPDGKKGATSPEGKVDMKGLDAEGKVKAKAPRFGISLSKSKKSSVSKADIEVKDDLKFKPPQVELDISLPTGKVDVTASQAEGPDVSGKGEGFQLKGFASGYSYKIPDVEIKAPLPLAKSEVEVEGPEGKLRMPTMPKIGISLPGVEGEAERFGVTIEGLEEKQKIGMKLPSVEIAAPKADVDLRLPKVQGGVDARMGDIEPKDISTKGEGFQIQMPKFGVSAKVPKVDMDISRGRGAGDIEVETPEGKLKMSEMKAPKIGFSFSKGKAEGEMDVSVLAVKLDADSPDGKYNTGIRLPSLDIAAPKLDVNITIPKGKNEVDASRDHLGQPPEPSIEIPDVTIKMPKISLSKFGTKGKEGELDAQVVVAPKVQGEVKPVKGGKIEIESPDIKAKSHKMKMPSFGLSLTKEKRDVSIPQVDLKTKEPEATAEGRIKFPALKMPSIDISVPEVPDIELPKAKIEISGEGEIKPREAEQFDSPELKFKMPKVSLPKFDMSAEAERHEMDIRVSPPKIGAAVKTPKIETGLKGSDLELRSGKISVPKVDIAVPKMKPLELELTPSKAELDLSIGKPKSSVKPPQVDIHLKDHGLEMEGAESKLSFPSVKMPSFNIDIPKVDLDINLPHAEAEIPELSIEEADAKWKMPKVSLPTFSGQDKEIDMGLDAPSPKFRADLKAPHIDADVKGADFTVKGTGITVPKIGISFGEDKPAQEGEVELRGPELKAKVDNKLPEGKFRHGDTSESLEAKLKLPSMKLPSVEISTPKLSDVDIDTSVPKGTLGISGQGDVVVDVSGETDGKWKSHKFSLPKFGMSGPKTKKGEGHIKSPQVELEADSPDIAVKGPRLKMPKFGISFPKAKQGVDFESSADISEPNFKADIKTPKGKIDVAGSKEKLESPETKMKLPSVKLPTVDISAPKVDVDINLPKGKGDVHVEGDADLPHDGDVGSPEISIEVPDVQLEMPKFSLPKFGGKSKEGGLDVDLGSSKAAAKAKIEGSADVSPGGIEVSVTDGKVKSKEGKMKMPKFRIPSFSMSKKEVDVSGERVEGGVTAPEMNIKLKKGKAEIQEPELDIESSEGKGKISFMKMPKFKMTSPKSKTLEGDLKLQADVDSRGSKDDLHGTDLHMKRPKITLPKFGSKEGKADVGADLTLPEAKVGADSSEIHIKLGKLKMPSLEISAPSGKPDVELSVPKPVVDISGADVEGHEGDLKMPSLNISAPSLELDFSLPKPKVGAVLEHEGKGEIDLEMSESKIQMPKVQLPTFGLSDLRGRDADTTGTELHVLARQKVKAPAIALKGQKVRLDIEGHEFSTEDDKATPTGSKIRMPTLDISLPKAKSGLEGPGFGGDDVEGKFTLPSVELPKISPPNIRSPELELDISLSKDDVSLDSGLGKTDFHMKVPNVELSGPDVEGTDFKFKMPKMKLPTFGGSSAEGKLDEGESAEAGIKGVKIKMPKLQLGSLKGKTEDYEVGTDGEVRTKGASTDVKSHDLEAHGGKLKFKVPTVGLSMGGAGAKEQDADMQPLHPTKEEGELKIRMPKISLPDVGFTEGEGKVDDGHPESDLKVDAKFKAPKAQTQKGAGIGDLEVDLGLSDGKMRLPHMKVPSIGIAGWKGKPDDDMTVSLGSKADFHGEELEGKKSHFKMPDVEFSGPKIKAHAEYEVDGGKLEHATCSDKELFGSPAKIGFKLKGDKKDVIQTPDMGEDDETRKRYQVKLPKFGISLPKVGLDGESDVSESKLKIETKDIDLKGHGDLSLKPGSAEHETERQDGKVKLPKVKKAVFVLVKSKEKGAEASSGLLESDVDSKAGTLEYEASSSEAKVKLPNIKQKPSFGRSRSKQKSSEVNGDVDSSTRVDDDAKTSKMKFPKLGFSKTDSMDVNVNSSGHSGSSPQPNGDHELSLQNGSQDSKAKLGKLKFPKLEFSSPYKVKEPDSEMNLKLVKMEEPSSKDEAHGSTFAAIKAAKFKSPKMSFSGFKKKVDKSEDLEGSTNIVASSARTEMASMEKEGEGEAKSGKAKISLGFFSSKSKGEYIVDNSGGTSHSEISQVAAYEGAESESREKTARFKFPKISMGPKSQGMVEMTSEHPIHEKRSYFQETEDDDSSAFKISLPQVGFTTYQEEHTSEEHVIGEEGGSILRVTKTKHIKAETGPETSTVI